MRGGGECALISVNGVSKGLWVKAKQKHLGVFYFSPKEMMGAPEGFEGGDGRSTAEITDRCAQDGCTGMYSEG